MLSQPLVGSVDIPRARIGGYKLQGLLCGLSHDGHIGFTTMLKSSIQTTRITLSTLGF